MPKGCFDVCFGNSNLASWRDGGGYEVPGSVGAGATRRAESSMELAGGAAFRPPNLGCLAGTEGRLKHGKCGREPLDEGGRNAAGKASIG